MAGILLQVWQTPVFFKSVPEAGILNAELIKLY